MGKGLLEQAKRVADTVMREHPGMYGTKWAYDAGLLLMGMEALYRETGERTYHEYVKAFFDYFILPDGTIRNYDCQEKNIDHINCGKNLFALYEETGEERFRIALGHLEEQLLIQPRTESGNYWHKQIYPNQIWLDGLFMGQPFRAQYAGVFGREEWYDDILEQFVMAEAKTYEPRCGLYAHACDESRSAFWADPRTGRSLNVWGRACGWYSMALVDTLEYIPEEKDAIRTQLAALLDKLMDNVVKYQDESGSWYQVLDSRRSDNYREATCTCQFAYTLEKAIRLRILEKEKYEPFLKAAVAAIENVFLKEHDGGLYMTRCCAVSGLGPENNTRRDGTLDYYFSEPVVENDGKALGPFFQMAAVYEEDDSVSYTV